MANVLQLTRLGSDQVFNLTKNTEFGRGKFEEGRWQVEDRTIPDIFDSLEARIIVEDNPHVSRNHAGIIQADGQFWLHDLDTPNGTYVNGQKIASNQPRLLKHLDHLSLDHNPRGKGDNRARMDFLVKLTQCDNYAILVGAGSDHIGCSEADVAQMSRYLGQRGYSVTSLVGRNANKARLNQELGRLKELAVTESSILFSFHGHGGPHGFSIGGQVYSPEDLYKRLNRIRSEKIGVIIEACHSGVFLTDENKEKMGPGISVLTASGETQYAEETRAYSLESEGDDAEPRYTGRMTKALIPYFKAIKDSSVLADFYAQIMDLSRPEYANLRSQNPQFFDAGFTVPKAITEILSVLPESYFKLRGK